METIKKQLMFSLLTGDMYEIEIDEYKNMDKYQIPLISRPSSSCKKCYGRMYSGKNLTMNIYIPCSRCMNKCIDQNLIKMDNLEIETIKNA
jgi:hypothetical protein